MSYLAKLKQIKGNENFENVPGMALPKPPKPPFGSFGSTNTEVIEKNIIDKSELARESRRLKVLAMLAEEPDSQRAIITDTETDPKNALVTIALRGMYSFHMQIPKHKYDPFLMLELIEKGSLQ